MNLLLPERSWYDYFTLFVKFHSLYFVDDYGKLGWGYFLFFELLVLTFFFSVKFAAYVVFLSTDLMCFPNTLISFYVLFKGKYP